METNKLLTEIREYFKLQEYMEDERAIVAQISEGVAFKGPTLWVLIFAILIASLGLNVGSTAVIIGAMLVSPLMGPIIGMGLAVGINDLELLKRAALNYGVATVISILTATLYFLLSPLNEPTSELLARTSPTLYDVLIAFCGGAAGIIALCTRGKGNVIPGVAIATALMPPLCTAGYGLATGHWMYFLGAFFLFFINTVFICLATYGGVRFMGFHEREFASAERARTTRRVLMAIVLLTMIPAGVVTFNIVRDSILAGNVRHFVKHELAQNGTQVLSHDIDHDGHTLRVVAVGKGLDDEILDLARERMRDYGLGDYQLAVIQGAKGDSVLAQKALMGENEHRQLVELSAAMTSMSEKYAPYDRLEQQAMAIDEEVKSLFPAVQHIGLARVTQPQADTTAVVHYVAAIATIAPHQRLTPADRTRLNQWLRLRLAADSLIVIDANP